jgi:transcriptional regulator GlxA family with amidase domain
MAKLNVGIYLFENMTMLDGFAPLQFFAFVEGFDTFTFAKEATPLRSDSGAVLTPDYGFADCPRIDVLVVPGGGDLLPQLKDRDVVAFVARAGGGAQYVTSVCSGALILAEAGLLRGYEAATHWAYTDLLAAYPDVTVVDKRVAIDRNRITGGGVTAGIDFALTVIGELASPAEAQALQLLFEYRPEPPFDAGSPDTAPAAIAAGVRAQAEEVTAGVRQHVGR